MRESAAPGGSGVSSTPVAAWQLAREAAEAAAPPTDPPATPTLRLVHAFDAACERAGIEHRLTKPYHPWTNGQVERMNRTIKDATVRRHFHDSHAQLRARPQLFLDAYDHARRVKTLRGLTPCEFVCKTWTEQPERFTRDPPCDTVGPNIQRARPRGGIVRRVADGAGGAGAARVPTSRGRAGPPRAPPAPTACRPRIDGRTAPAAPVARSWPEGGTGRPCTCTLARPSRRAGVWP